MVVAYLDSSTIVRQYLTDEPTTADLVAITRGTGSLATARLSYIEVRAALAAARRASRIEPSRHRPRLSRRSKPTGERTRSSS